MVISSCCIISIIDVLWYNIINSNIKSSLQFVWLCAIVLKCQHIRPENTMRYLSKCFNVQFHAFCNQYDKTSNSVKWSYILPLLITQMYLHFNSLEHRVPWLSFFRQPLPVVYLHVCLNIFSSLSKYRDQKVSLCEATRLHSNMQENHFSTASPNLIKQHRNDITVTRQNW